LRTGCSGVRDLTFDEDRSQARTGNAPHVMATLRKHRHQLPPTGRLNQHRHHPTTSRQTPRQHRYAHPDLLNYNFAGALVHPSGHPCLPGQTWRSGCPPNGVNLTGAKTVWRTNRLSPTTTSGMMVR